MGDQWVTMSQQGALVATEGTQMVSWMTNGGPMGDHRLTMSQQGALVAEEGTQMVSWMTNG